MNNQDYAGFWLRVKASLIDTVMLIAIIAIPLTMIYGTDYWTNGSVNTPMFHGVWDVVLNHILPLVAVLWFWHRYGATPGKIMLGLKIVDAETGREMTTGQSVGRYFAYILSTLPLCLGFIWIAFDPRKQAWHDKLAGTVVVRQHIM